MIPSEGRQWGRYDLPSKPWETLRKKYWELGTIPKYNPKIFGTAIFGNHWEVPKYYWLMVSTPLKI